MGRGEFVYTGVPLPKIEIPEYNEFLLNFQKAMLSSLVKRKLLTAAQMVQVLAIIIKKPSFR